MAVGDGIWGLGAHAGAARTLHGGPAGAVVEEEPVEALFAQRRVLQERQAVGTVIPVLRIPAAGYVPFDHVARAS